MLSIFQAVLKKLLGLCLDESRESLEPREDPEVEDGEIVEGSEQASVSVCIYTLTGTFCLNICRSSAVWS
jgi:hypothetical protein